MVALVSTVSMGTVVHANDDDSSSASSLKQEEKTKEIPVPIITYGQKVEIVVPLKKDPNILLLEIKQEDKDVSLDLTVGNNCNKDMAKALGLKFLMRTKTVTLDDPSEEGIPGKGLYNYKILVRRSTGKTVAEGEKPFDKKEIEWF